MRRHSGDGDRCLMPSPRESRQYEERVGSREHVHRVKMKLMLHGQ